jgi:hypothetical protein
MIEPITFGKNMERVLPLYSNPYLNSANKTKALA